MFPHQNPLPKPEIIKTPSFDNLFQTIKNNVLDYLNTNAPDDVEAVAETFENQAELMTKLTEAFTVILQSHFRQMNAQALQMFGMYATGDDMVDLIVSQLGIERQIIDEGDPNAFPEVPATMESNDALLTRYYLAVYALATTGTRSGYRFNAMTLGGRPKIQLESLEANTVIMKYEFLGHDMAGQTKDAQARQVAPGEVDCYILSHTGNGTPSNALLEATQAYLERDDIAQETDLLTVKAPNIVNWSCEATLFVMPGVDEAQAKQLAEQAVQDYASQQHRLSGSIEPSMLYSILLKATGAYRGELNSVTTPIRCQYSEAPYLESVNITVAAQNP
ncbi:baseplate J/gp47 family protein [Marinomonas posidonica]|uniref:baseplate J/gp47 family protein n=1 Tax=Marinomonas posidonica TaxID=936476 RepID=UPI0037351B95